MTNNTSGKYKDLGDRILQNVWGKRVRGSKAPKIDWSGPIKHEDVLYLLSRYPFLQIMSSSASFPEEIHPKFITANSGWVIHDYGDAMSSSPGDLMFGNYSIGLGGESEETEGGGEGSSSFSAGKGTIVNQAFMTAQQMIEIAIAKGWPGVEIVNGSPLMQWAAWMAAEDRNLAVTGFEPSEKDKERRKRIRNLYEEAVERPEPKLGL
jgi:hypothetical protein